MRGSSGVCSGEMWWPPKGCWNFCKRCYSSKYECGCCCCPLCCTYHAHRPVPFGRFAFCRFRSGRFLSPFSHSFVSLFIFCAFFLLLNEKHASMWRTQAGRKSLQKFFIGASPVATQCTNLFGKYNIGAALTEYHGTQIVARTRSGFCIVGRNIVNHLRRFSGIFRAFETQI